MILNVYWDLLTNKKNKVFFTDLDFSSYGVDHRDRRRVLHGSRWIGLNDGELLLHVVLVLRQLLRRRERRGADVARQLGAPQVDIPPVVPHAALGGEGYPAVLAHVVLPL